MSRCQGSKAQRQQPLRHRGTSQSEFPSKHSTLWEVSIFPAPVYSISCFVAPPQFQHSLNLLRTFTYTYTHPSIHLLYPSICCPPALQSKSVESVHSARPRPHIAHAICTSERLTCICLFSPCHRGNQNQNRNLKSLNPLKKASSFSFS